MNSKENRSKSQIPIKNTEKIHYQENKYNDSNDKEILNNKNEEIQSEKLSNLSKEANKIEINSMRKKMSLNEINQTNTYQSFNQDIDQIQFKLKRVFEYYCQFGERMNINSIKSQKFYKLISDSALEDNTLNKTRIELIFSSENKHKSQMNYESFLSSLIKVSEIKYAKEKMTSSKSLQKLISNHILPLYEKIFENNINSSMISKNQGSFLNNESSFLESKNSIIMCNNNELIFETDILEIISIVAPILLKIYRVYFPFELSNNEDENFIIESSQKLYFTFLKEFDMWPTLISKSLAFNIFQSEINNILDINDTYMKMIENTDINNAKKYGTKNFLGQYFNFFKFIRSIIRISDICFEKLETNLNRKLTMFEKFCLLLERMELSIGFQTFELKNNKTHNRKNSKLVPTEIIEKVKFNVFDNPQTDLDIDDGKEVENVNNQSRSIISKYRKSISGIAEKMSFDHSPYIQENWGNELFNIFKYYCSYGEPLNTQFMKNTKWTKFLREAGLVRTSNKQDNSMNMTKNISIESGPDYGLKFNEIDTIFFKIISNNNYNNNSTNNLNVSVYSRDSMSMNSSVYLNKDPLKKNIVNSNAKIDFSTFINILEVTCLMIIPNKNPKEAINFLITNHIIPLTQLISNKNDTSVHVNFLLEKQTTPELVQILALVHKAFLPVYKFYCTKNTYLMAFEQFQKFCVDFSIFPDICSKSKLFSFFKSISSCMQITDYNGMIVSNKDNVDYIDDNYFVDMLALCAFEIPYRDPQPSNLDKILYFIEKLAQTEGTNKILKLTGSTRLLNGESLDILGIFKQNYPDFFSIKVVEKPKFFDLLAD